MDKIEGLVKVLTAILSVSDKQGLVEFAKVLESFGVEMLATGGTHSELVKGAVRVKSLQDDLKLPTSVSGRVKTLHAPLHAGILAKGTEGDLRELKEMGVKPVDMVVCNFYPFREALARAPEDVELVESIDIGGPTMVRAASKNFQRVAVVPSPKLYPQVLEELRRNSGGTTLSFRRKLALQAFSMTSAYDASIFNGLGRGEEAFPERFVLSAVKLQEAKYGENPDRKAVIYAVEGCRTMGEWKQLAGDSLSFNNFLDVGSSYRILEGLEGVAAVATVKHGQVSGFAFAPNVSEAYRLAHACDPEADYGGTVVTNREVDAAAAGLIGKNEGVEDASVYTEIVLAPGYTGEALEILKSKQKKPIRLIQATARPDFPYDLKVVEGAILVQDVVDYRRKLDPAGVTVPTRRRPEGAEMAKLLSAWEVVRKVQSNGIVIADGSFEGGELVRFWTLGVASFRKRNGAVRIALENAGERAKGAVCASDGFFPFRDSVDLLGAAGVTSVIQPGGSVRDVESVRAADERKMAMVMTHVRAFKH
ncbi:MAG: bifunctional phosphoribosylaminoimidazolecarboxamide formyltransferase/IMP cyclohydrolase [Thaumarchaeota archaeon]|nr:bifunctional phosphoribosylaminoimidazolecarboxamide formyltransferase/IMP cyclohydrolase [Nitrososphaerota archaeon]